MAAESLPFSFGALSSWELEAWYEDLQEVLSSDENRGTVFHPGNKEVRMLGLMPGEEEVLPFPLTNSYLPCLISLKEESKPSPLDPASLAWLTEEPGPPEVTRTSQSPCSQSPVRAPWLRRKKRKTKEDPSGNRVASPRPRAGKQRMKRRKNKKTKGKWHS